MNTCTKQESIMLSSSNIERRRRTFFKKLPSLRHPNAKVPTLTERTKGLYDKETKSESDKDSIELKMIGGHSRRNSILRRTSGTCHSRTSDISNDSESVQHTDCESASVGDPSSTGNSSGNSIGSFRVSIIRVLSRGSSLHSIIGSDVDDGSNRGTLKGSGSTSHSRSISAIVLRGTDVGLSRSTSSSSRSARRDSLDFMQRKCPYSEFKPRVQHPLFTEQGNNNGITSSL